MRDLFTLNRPLVLFVYGQTFFIMGLAIFLQSRRHSRLRLARDLRWLAVFGILHGLHEWGDVFIPLQSAYLPVSAVEFLLTLQIVLLALSFICLMVFGAVTLESRWKHGIWIVVVIAAVWGMFFWATLFSLGTFERWYNASSIWARYLLGLSGSLLAAYGLRYQAETSIKPLGSVRIYQTLRLAGASLIAYAIAGGLIVRPWGFFPASFLNRDVVESIVGIPIEVFRSAVGLVMAFSVIRALEVFDIEVDRLIEGMEMERIKADERDRIGQEIHDGAIQGIYSAGLILDSLQGHLKDEEGSVRLDRAKRVLQSAISDLRRYMISLRTDVPSDSLVVGLQRLVNDPRFSSLLTIRLEIEAEPILKPTQVGYILAIMQESLSNAIRHANARHMTISLKQNHQALTLHIEDDGQGFAENEINPGFGLRAMRDRARLLGADFTINSRIGKGTAITLSIPEEGDYEHAADSPGR